MNSASKEGAVLVTGAGGHIGRTFYRVLRGRQPEDVIAVDLDRDPAEGIRACDLRSESQVAALFEHHRIDSVIHLAGMLPTAFQSRPLAGAEVNVGGSVRLIRHSIRRGIKRFVFASSLSVYGTRARERALDENDPAAPDEVYGAAKRTIELIGENLSQSGALEFLALRIARVVGPGVQKTSSPWRAKIFETEADSEPIRLPFSPDALLSLVHVEDVARMLLILVEAPQVKHSIYNTPVEIWKANQLKETLRRLRDTRVELDPENGHDGGPTCDGSRFIEEFDFRAPSLCDRLASRH